MSHSKKSNKSSNKKGNVSKQPQVIPANIKEPVITSPTPTTSEATKNTHHVSRHHLNHIHLSLVISILITGLCMYGNIKFMQQPNGKRFAYLGYDMIQDARIKYFDNSPVTTQLPITVVNISHLPKVSAKTVDTGEEPARDRNELMKLLNIIAKQKPAAIGVDVDFSKDYHGQSESGDITPLDTLLFRQCREIDQSGIPVYLGIKRSLFLPKKDWLFSDIDGKSIDYNDMAASIAVEKLQYRRLPLWTKFNDFDICPSLNNRIALAYINNSPNSDSHYNNVIQFATGKAKDETDGFFTRRFETGAWGGDEKFHTENKDNSSKICTYLVDYAPLNALINSRIDYTKNGDPKSLNNLKDRIVLIGLGDPNSNEDIKKINENLHAPGVYLHACGIATLISHQPICELTEAGRLVIDSVLSGVSILVIYLLSLHLHRKKKHLITEKLQKHIYTLLALLVFIVAIVWSPAYGLVWDDFLIVVAVLLIHPPLDYMAENIIHVFKHFDKRLGATITDAYTKPIEGIYENEQKTEQKYDHVK